MGWDGESGVTISLGLVWSSVAPGAGKTPPQGEPKGQTNWSPCWALLWAKSCWFEELPDPGAFTDGHQQRHLVSLPLSLLPRHHPSPWQAENILSPLHSTPPPLVTGQAQGVSGVSLVCREDEDGHEATAHSGSLSSEAPVVAQPALGSLELSIVPTS